MQRITDSLSKAAFVCAIAFLAALIPAKSMGQNAAVTDSYVANDRPPDARFKADILVVVAHPDDEVLVTAYLAREVLDNHKRVAVVYGTRGDGGNNEIGPEQALAMGQIRELAPGGTIWEGRLVDAVLSRWRPKAPTYPPEMASFLPSWYWNVRLVVWV